MKRRSIWLVFPMQCSWKYYVCYGVHSIRHFTCSQCRESIYGYVWKKPLEVVKWILWYLKGSTNIGLCFDKRANSDCKNVGYSDSDFAGDLDKRRSLIDYAFTLSDCVISWKTTLQLTVALSTKEAEDMTVTDSERSYLVKRFDWKSQLTPRSKYGVCDSQSAIHLTKHQMYHERTKHIDFTYHFIWEIKVIKVKKIGITNNSADMMTKPVPSSSIVSNYLVFKVVKVEPVEPR